MKEQFRHIGRETHRILGSDIVTGKAMYVADNKVPGMKYGKILRSPYPFARIVSVDKSEALAMDGVACVVTWQDIAGEGISVNNGFTPPRHPNILDEYVRYVGDAVALVVADTEDLAMEAMDKIKVEYEQLEQQYDNEKEVLAAEYKVQELDFSIFRKGLAEMKRTLDDAQIRSPRKAILTYINNQIGAQVSQGSQLAVISDLSHFKVEGEIADTYGDRVAAGGKAIVKIGSEKLEGTVSSVTPLSKNGVISFTVQLNEDNNRRLRSGLKTDVYVMNAVKEDVMRIANASYYVGRGEYELFVRNSDKEIVKRKVQLGDSNFEFVEVASGLQPGDQVVVSDMSNYKNKNKLKLN